MGMIVTQSKVGEFSLNRMHLGDRIAEAEVEIERILRKHGVKFALNTHKHGEMILNQELVLIDRKEG